MITNTFYLEQGITYINSVEVIKRKVKKYGGWGKISNTNIALGLVTNIRCFMFKVAIYLLYDSVVMFLSGLRDNRLTPPDKLSFRVCFVASLLPNFVRSLLVIANNPFLIAIDNHSKMVFCCFWELMKIRFRNIVVF